MFAVLLGQLTLSFVVELQVDSHRHAGHIAQLWNMHSVLTVSCEAAFCIHC